jgi:hypothetical protein
MFLLFASIRTRARSEKIEQLSVTLALALVVWVGLDWEAGCFLQHERYEGYAELVFWTMMMTFLWILFIRL